VKRLEKTEVRFNGIDRLLKLRSVPALSQEIPPWKKVKEKRKCGTTSPSLLLLSYYNQNEVRPLEPTYASVTRGKYT